MHSEKQRVVIDDAIGLIRMMKALMMGQGRGRSANDDTVASGRRRRDEEFVVVLELDDDVDVEEGETNRRHEYEHDVQDAHVDDVAFRHLQLTLVRMLRVFGHREEWHRDCHSEQPD